MNEQSTTNIPQVRATSSPSDVQLTNEQEQAVDDIVSFCLFNKNTKREFKLGGYAGTGKTTVIKSVIKELDLHDSSICVVVCAFTGKAVNVLNKKGIPAQTMHSLMYECVQDPKTYEIEFVKMMTMANSPDFVIVDESSMVSQELYNDLMSYGKKVLFVGDPGQLEPVGSNPNLMHEPDVILSKIHRQAEKSPIITLANNIRLGQSLPNFQQSSELVIRGKNFSTENLIECNQVLVATNKDRNQYNTQVRLALGLPSTTVTINEKIIVLRNNIKYGVFNGMILFVKDIKQDAYDYWLCDCEDEVGKKYLSLKLWKPPITDKFFDPKGGDQLRIPRDRVWFDYGYVITVHKSQGSEWDHVFCVDKWMPPQVWDVKRWRYTAITRAAKKLTYAK